MNACRAGESGNEPQKGGSEAFLCESSRDDEGPDLDRGVWSGPDVDSFVEAHPITGDMVSLPPLHRSRAMTVAPSAGISRVEPSTKERSKRAVGPTRQIDLRILPIARRRSRPTDFYR
ncbi:MAG: hypothetical protein ACR2NZ_06650 [Rubripirellula sp.]